MKLKYAPLGKKQKGSPGKGKASDPNNWITGPDIERREKYYAYLKHRSQATYRGELYLLTWEDWEHMWTDRVWYKRGRRIKDLCLTRLDFGGAWSMDNVVICSRRQHFELKKNNNAKKSTV